MADCIPYKNIPYYSDLIIDYLDEKQPLQFAYHRFPKLENFKAQIEEKKQSFSIETRKTLVSALQKQYQNTDVSKLTTQNIEDLAKEKTFTITTGHQLNLFTGPLYFFYKIISVINLTKELKQAYPEYNFVPMYWLASEDHDFEEINFFNYGNQQIWWDTDQAGAVGRFSTERFEKVFKRLDKELNTSVHADTLRNLFKKAYIEHDTLTAATRYLANALLGEYGLVILDGDDQALKTEFAPYMKRELLQETAYQQVNKTANQLKDLGYKVQVNPREINLFYLRKNARDRLVKENGVYFLYDTEKRFTEQEILEELKTHPERFSPNAIMRPLYQEIVLPNLCYVGGSGELAYWLELKAYFEAEKIVFPVLLMRNSGLLVTEKQEQKRQKLNIATADLFLPQADLKTKHTKAISDISIDFTPQKEHLQQQFKDLYALAKKTDKSFIGAVAAQEKKQLNGLAHLEKRLLKAQKRKLKDELKRATRLQDQLFPNGNLQERVVNFSTFYEGYGEELLPRLFKDLEPLKMEFNVITL